MIKTWFAHTVGNVCNKILAQVSENPEVVRSNVQEVQCPTCGSVSKAKLKAQLVVIAPHPPRKLQPVRNVPRWLEQGDEWVCVKKKE